MGRGTLWPRNCIMNSVKVDFDFPEILVPCAACGLAVPTFV